MTKGHKLTNDTIRTLPAGPKGDAIYPDADSKQGVPGLYLRVRKSGSRTFVIQWRQGDFQRRSTVGKVGVLTLDDARKKARKLLVGIDEGHDPVAAKARAKVTDKLLFEAVAKEYLAAREADMKASSLDQCTRHLQLYFKPFNRLAITKIDRALVAAELRAISKARGAVPADRARSTLSAFYAWCIGEGYANDNPVIGTNKASAGEDAYSQVGTQIASGGVDKATIGRVVGLGPSGAPLLTAIGNLGKSEQTDTLKNLAAENRSRVERGLKPLSPLEYQTAVSNAGKNQTIVNMPPQEKAYDAAAGKGFWDLNEGIIKGATTAQATMASLDRLQQLLDEPGVYQGTAGDKVLQAKKIAKSMGIDVAEGLGPAETVQAISNDLALKARNPASGAGMPGAMSDADRNFLAQMQPGLEKTPEGNRILIDAQRRVNQRALDVEKLRRDYIRKNGRLNEGFYAVLSDYADKNPLFPQTAPRVATPAAINGVQPKQAPNGNYYIPDPNRPGSFLQVVQ